jgi:hypothetical protein
VACAAGNKIKYKRLEAKLLEPKKAREMMMTKMVMRTLTNMTMIMVMTMMMETVTMMVMMLATVMMMMATTMMTMVMAMMRRRARFLLPCCAGFFAQNGSIQCFPVSRAGGKIWVMMMMMMRDDDDDDDEDDD